VKTLLELWRYRLLLVDLVRQDFRSRYAGSVIGVFWNVLQPAAQVFIFAVVLARIVGSRLPVAEQFQRVDDPFALSIYICAGLLPWIAMSETLSRNTTAFLAHSNLIKKVAFPHPILVMYQVVSGIITLGIMLGLFLLFILLTGHRVGISIVWLPVVMVLQALFTYGLGLLLATITAHFRDMPQLVGIALQLWFWLTPIVYFRDLVTRLASFAPTLLRLNPLYHLTNLYQNLLFKQVVYLDFVPNTLVPTQDQFLFKLGVMAVLSFALLIGATIFYGKLRTELPDQI
jgi:lipopolysaccharide transport system permease protein